MKIKDLLIEKKPQIIKKWFDSIADISKTSALETSPFLKNLKKQFNHPAKSMIIEGMEGIFDGIINDSDIEKTAPFLDSIIRLRAVQDITPSKAVSFTTILKKTIRDELSDDIRKHQLFEQLQEIESKIDMFTYLSFDIYMECREKLFNIRTKEVKDMTYRLIQSANRANTVRKKRQGS